ncbi:MAG: two-component regulator propeller domain-containing protein [Blastocatellia bacterium]
MFIARLLFTFILLAVLTNNVKGQPKSLVFENLTIDDGLSINTVNSIVQDKQGYLWFASNDGLNRFDGYNFYILRNQKNNPNSLSDNYITDLAVDSTGNIWIATNNGGINKFDIKTEKITLFNSAPNKLNSLSSNSISKIYTDKVDRIWIATPGKGLNLLDERTNTVTTFKNDPNNPKSISSNYITIIYQDKEENLWIGTDKGLNLFDEKSKSFSLKTIPSNDNTISSIVEDINGTLWITTKDTLCKYDKKTDSFFCYPISVIDEIAKTIYTACVDPSGLIWIGTTKGLLQFDPKTEQFTHYQKDKNTSLGLNSDFIREIFFDYTGTMWLGTLDGGINKFDPISKRFLTTTNTPNNQFSSNNSVVAIAEDLTKTIWISKRDELRQYKSKNSPPIIFHSISKLSPELANKRINSLFVNSSGLLWIGTDKGLSVYDTKLEKFITDTLNLPPVLQTLRITSIYQDSKEKLWIGSQNIGVYLFDPKSLSLSIYEKESKEAKNHLSSNRIMHIYEDKTGTIWIATTSRLCRYDPTLNGITKIYLSDPENPNSLISDQINMVFSDKDGLLWVGTSFGLNKFDPQKEVFSTPLDNSKLPNSHIYAVLADNQECLWLSTNKGLVKYDPKNNQLWTYDVSDGLQSNEFNYGAYFKSSSGEMFFGGVNGFNRFYPEEIKNNSFVPNIVVTDFKILDENYKIISNKKFLPSSYQLDLNYNENYLLFEFAALNFNHPEKNNYLYKLEGLEKQWSNYDGKQRFAKYSRLAPGDYTFQVIGSNNDGLWNQNGVAIKIHISPPFWQTNGAYLFYLVFSISSIYGIHRYNLNLVETRNKQLEKKVEERTSEINKQSEVLAKKNQELAKNYAELLELNQKANRIFAALSEALPGTTLDGKYRLEEKIGAGGFGAVYRAINLNINREVAIKVFSPSPGNDSAENLARFQQEAISTCRVNHLNAVAVLDSGISSEGIPYLVMELLQGQTLKMELRAKGRLTLERCAEIVLPICKVLEKAHATGLLHRDIKPDNIFLHQSSEGEIVKVVDFGIAKLINAPDNISNDLTKTGGLIGTPIYMAPERLMLKDYDESSDIYSLGVMIYQMLSGQFPFIGNLASFYDIKTAHLLQTPKSLKSFNPNIDEKIENIILKTLNKNPGQRATLKEVGEIFSEITKTSITLSTNVAKTESLAKINTKTSNVGSESATIIISNNKPKPETEKITPSEQITLRKTDLTN